MLRTPRFRLARGVLVLILGFVVSTSLARLAASRRTASPISATGPPQPRPRAGATPLPGIRPASRITRFMPGRDLGTLLTTGGAILVGLPFSLLASIS